MHARRTIAVLAAAAATTLALAGCSSAAPEEAATDAAAGEGFPITNLDPWMEGLARITPL